MNTCENCGKRNNFSCSNLFCNEKGNVMNECISNNYKFWKSKDYKMLEKAAGTSNKEYAKRIYSYLQEANRMTNILYEMVYKDKQLEDLQAENKIVKQQLEEAKELIVNLIYDDDCRFDHHVYCKEHGWMDKNCPHGLAKPCGQFLKSLESRDNSHHKLNNLLGGK